MMASALTVQDADLSAKWESFFEDYLFEDLQQISWEWPERKILEVPFDLVRLHLHKSIPFGDSERLLLAVPLGLGFAIPWLRRGRFTLLMAVYGAFAFGSRQGRTPWFFGQPICPLCRVVWCYGVDADCKAVGNLEVPK